MRAKYFLRMRGVDLETQVIEDKQLLMEIMEEQEALMEMNVEDRKKRASVLEAKVHECLAEAETLLDHHGDLALILVTQLVKNFLSFFFFFFFKTFMCTDCACELLLQACIRHKLSVRGLKRERDREREGVSCKVRVFFFFLIFLCRFLADSFESKSKN